MLFIKSNLIFLSFCLIFNFSLSVNKAQDKHVKNVIMLIPDGTSTSVLSLTRWYKYGICPSDACSLYIDKYISGLVKTHSSDAPIGDSAPTGSTYATGYLSHTGYIATYPPANIGKDLVKIDPAKAYQPLFTVLEAAKKNNKSTGLVVTCQFPHATPADFSAHTPHRDKYDLIAKQMVYNNLNVMFGGGTKYLNAATREDKEDLVLVLKNKKYNYLTHYSDFKKLTPADSLVWGLFANDYLPFDLDTNKDSIPSLAEMTDKAIKILSANKNGFFLMVEGSKVDWAAHNNDPVGVVSEFLAFDNAVEVAMKFAEKDGNTAVVICPDHGNSAISAGNKRTNKGYDTLSISALVNPLRDCKLTAEGLATLLMTTQKEYIAHVFKINTNIDLKKHEIDTLNLLIKAGRQPALVRPIAKIITANTFIGFNTNGHTGEDVMLANYHPHNYKLTGVVQNTDVNKYMVDVLGLPDLDSYTNKYYCIDSIALKGLSWKIIDTPIDDPKDHKDVSAHYGKLLINLDKAGKRHAIINSNTDFVSIYNGEKIIQHISLGSIALYMYETDKNHPITPFSHFYIPRDLGLILEQAQKK